MTGIYVLWVLIPNVELEDIDKVDTLKADSRGRVAIGPEFADRAVKVYVVDAECDQ
jgi:hypothetical protein